MATATKRLDLTFAAAEDFGINEVVSQLRLLRDESLVSRRRVGKPVLLPSRSALTAIVDDLSRAIFPNRLGAHLLASDCVDFYVGNKLDVALRELSNQALVELQFTTGNEFATDDQRAFAFSIVHRFARSLPKIRSLLETDILAAYDGDAAVGSVDEVLACYPGIVAIISHRLAHELHVLNLPLVARMIAEISHSATGIDIHPGAQIADSFFIDHGTGVVIGETAVIGRRVKIHHGVTLGGKDLQLDENEETRRGDRHPIVEDDVVIYAGATILGRVTIGRGCVIGGNVWLTKSVAPGTLVSQAHALSESYDEGGGI